MITASTSIWLEYERVHARAVAEIRRLVASAGGHVDMSDVPGTLAFSSSEDGQDSEVLDSVDIDGITLNGPDGSGRMEYRNMSFDQVIAVLYRVEYAVAGEAPEADI